MALKMLIIFFSEIKKKQETARSCLEEKKTLGLNSMENLS